MTRGRTYALLAVGVIAFWGLIVAAVTLLPEWVMAAGGLIAVMGWFVWLAYLDRDR